MRPLEATETRRARLAPLAFGAIAVAAVIGRLVLAHRSVYPSYDGAFYLSIARSILGGSVPYSSFPPGWPAIVAAVAGLRGRGDPQALLDSAQLANVGLGLVAAVLLYVLARPRCGRRWAAAIALVWIVLPVQVRLSVSDLSEISYATGLVAALVLYQRRHRFLSGVGWGLSYLVRPEALVGWGGLLVVDLLARDRDADLRRRRGWLLMLLGGAIAIVPYVVFLGTATGAFRLSSKMGFLFEAYRQNPGLSYLLLYLRNAATLAAFALEMLGPVVVALALVGLATRRSFWHVALAPLLLYPLFSFRMEPRYLVPYAPFLLLSAVVGLGALSTRPWARWPRLSLRRAVLGLALVNLAGSIAVGFTKLRVNEEYYPGMREAGLWLAEQHVSTDTLVVGRKPYVSFWAGCAFARAPETESISALLDWANSVGADYLVVHAGLTGGLGGATVALLEKPTPQLQRRVALAQVFTVPGQPNETTFLFRLRREDGPGPAAP